MIKIKVPLSIEEIKDLVLNELRRRDLINDEAGKHFDEFQITQEKFLTCFLIKEKENVSSKNIN